MSYHIPDPQYSWDDQQPNHAPMLHQLTSNEAEKGEVVANLWVPDIEQRYGWREVWIRRPIEEAKQRKAGFR